ncbi:MAG: response regulator [bacterium]|nr:response regulator [bacterium]
MPMKILVVDDSAMMRKIIRTELQGGGFETFEAADGIEALEQVARNQPDLITLDVDMPRLNGYDTCFRLRSTELESAVRKIPVIFVTANDTIEGRNKGFEVGASEFITKPFLRGEILSAVERTLKPEKAMQGLKAVIAEDNKIARQLLESLLEAEGIETIVTKNGVEALEAIRGAEQDIDLVVTDFMMPEMNGDELCKKIRFELGLKSLPVIFLSGMAERDSILQMFKAGASDYVIKPFAKEELLARIRVHMEARRLTRKLEYQVMELKKLNKLKDEFLSVTSHDLRAPLNGIMGFTELLMLEEGLNSQQKEYLGHVRQSGEFLLDLIGDILYLGRMGSESAEVEQKPVSLKQVIEASTQTLRHMATPKKQQLVIENRCHTDPVIMGDHGSLMRVFNNLLSNAIKFTPKEGDIRQIIEETPQQISISVIDSGIGIPADKLPFLFDKFSKTSRSGTSGEAGTGLGLAITKELVARHHGKIEVSSTVGEGTRFTLTFPKIGAEVAAKKPATGPDLTAPFKPVEPLHCLLIDDNQLNLKLGATVLKKQGYSVDTATDGQEAVMKYIEYRMQKRPLHLLFMDVRMPGMDGLEATRRIREFEGHKKLNRIPIWAMTAGTSENEKQACSQAGMDGFLTKPINLTQLQEMLAKTQDQ